VFRSALAMIWGAFIAFSSGATAQDITFPLTEPERPFTETREPFTVSAKPGLAAVVPGEVLPVAVVLDIADGHKVYEETVSIRAAKDAPLTVDAVVKPDPLVKFDELSGGNRNLYVERAVFAAHVTLKDVPAAGETVRVALDVRYQGCSHSMCFLPETKTVTLDVPVAPRGGDALRVNQELFEGLDAPDAAPTGTQPGSTPPSAGGDDFTRRTPIVAILAAFGLGLLLSFTPCVYPLIPVTVAVIGARTKDGGWRRGLVLSLVYVLGLSITYAVLGVIAATGGSSVGAASQHWAAVLVVSALFVALAVSMFGVYDLELPAKWQAKLRVKKGGWGSVFVTGALSGLVATPCVAAPLASILVYIATTGSIVLGATMLFTMAWGMGALLILAGTFSGFTSKLPKAGGWMVAVKTVMGVILIVAALYFARGALPDWLFSPYLATALVVLGVWPGAIMKAAPGAPRWRFAIKAAGVIALTLGIYAALGAGVARGLPVGPLEEVFPGRILPSREKIAFRTDYHEALAEARESGRPVMLDFVMPNCAGCRQIEHEVFSRTDVADLAERFVTVRVDLATPPLPVEELKKTYRIFGAPSVIWIDSSGTILHDLTIVDGETPPGEFVKRLESVK